MGASWLNDHTNAVTLKNYFGEEIERVRFHDLRHTAVTVMAEKGLAEHVIMAQVGHISHEMLKHCSHVRRQALNSAAAALEPTFQKPQATAEMVN